MPKLTSSGVAQEHQGRQNANVVVILRFLAVALLSPVPAVALPVAAPVAVIVAVALRQSF
jgi:hypothetical protein